MDYSHDSAEDLFDLLSWYCCGCGVDVLCIGARQLSEVAVSVGLQDFADDLAVRQVCYDCDVVCTLFASVDEDDVVVLDRGGSTIHRVAPHLECEEIAILGKRFFDPNGRRRNFFAAWALIR